MKEREKADGVYVKAEDLKGWGGDEWKVSDRERDRETEIMYQHHQVCLGSCC